MAVNFVINLSQNIKFSELLDVGRNGRLEYIPAICYSIQKNTPLDIDGPYFYYFERPFSLSEKNAPIELLVKYAKNEMWQKKDLIIAKKAYQKIKTVAYRSAERIIADYFCAVILRILNKNDKFLFIFEGPPTDKLLARIGYLNLALKNVILIFISHKPEDLLTSVMSYSTGKFQYDFHRLLNEDGVEPKGPYPGSSDESLIQTYFYKYPIESEKAYFPIRIDIFCQNLLTSDLDNIIEQIKKILRDSSWVAPFKISDGTYTKLPVGLIKLIDSWEILYNKQLERILKS
jgi:hypothetical protein